MKKFMSTVVSKVLPSGVAEAATCCGDGWVYQYRCYNGLYQRRRCTVNCSCYATACGSWVTVAKGC